jgi:hypothetical protein
MSVYHSDWRITPLKESNGLPMEKWHPIYTIANLLDAITPDLKATRGEKN